MVDLSHCKRAWMITDTHLGVRNSQEEWIEIHREYFYNFFLPLVKKEYKPGDVMIHLGDVFDSRHAITLKVLNLAIDIFEELSKIFVDGIFIIAGNHDSWYRTSNQINSLKVFKWTPNIHIFDEPESLKVGKFKFLLMPWRKDHEADKDAVTSLGPGHDFLLCHMDIYGMKSNRSSILESGTDVKTFSMFKRVYSGHIHYAQKIDNIIMLGTPYELTRACMANKKGVTILDAETGDETFFENKYSPRFISYPLSFILEKTPEELKNIFVNNFVDIRIDSPNFLRIPVNGIMDLLDNQYRSISFIPPSYDNSISTDYTDDELKDFDIKESIKVYSDGAPYDDGTKKRLADSLIFLMGRAIELKDKV